MYGGHWIGMGFGWLIGLGFIILIIWLVTRSVNHDSYHRNYGQNYNNIQSNNSSAMNILKERFAKGEIGKEEFEEKKKLIES